jgi:succinate dehydrogenase / fumarate reductase cytochrome b subunit
MIAVISVHIFFGIQLTLENRSAKPDGYAVNTHLRSTFASRNMIWTGLILAAFILYHLLHFTAQVINPEISAQLNADSLGRPDVFRMVVLNFQNLFISLGYIFGMTALMLHLAHGMQSSFQTLGLGNETAQPITTKASSVAAFILFLGYISIPLVILMGIISV